MIVLSEHIPVRFHVGVLLFIGGFTTYMLNVNMSINIISMVKPINIDSNDSSTETGDDLINHGPRYQWSLFDQSLILGAHSWGSLMPNLFGGVLAEKFGGRNLIGYSFIISAIITCLAPIAASDNFIPIFIIRLCIGLLGGFFYPSAHGLISKWAPPDEKGKFFASLMGSLLGTVVTWPTAGLIIEKWGWQYAFYAPGLITFVTAALWMYFVTNSPQTHSRISRRELEYIEKSHGDTISKQRAWPPLGQLLLSMPFWALVVSHFGNCWGYFFLLTEAPIFMTKALGFSLTIAGLLASAPILGRMILGFTFGSIGDHIRRNNLLSVVMTRKSFLSLSHIIPGIMLIIMCFLENNTYLIVSLMTIAFSLNGAITISCTPGSHDLAPNYAGVIYGIINFVGVTSGFLAPILVSYFTRESNSFTNWSYLFIITGGLYIITALFFLVFGSGEVQKWNAVTHQKVLK